MGLCLHLREDGIHIGGRGLHRRRNGVVRALTPRGDAHGHAVFQRVGAQVGVPGPHGDDDVHGRPGRVYPHDAVAAVYQWADIAGRKPVGTDDLQRGVHQLVDAVGQLDLGNLAAAMQPFHMVAQAEHVGFVLVGHLVAANALEHAGAVVQRMRQHMGRRLRPRHQLAVLPDVIDLGDVGQWNHPFLRLEKPSSRAQREQGPLYSNTLKRKSSSTKAAKPESSPQGQSEFEAAACHFYVGIIGIRATFTSE